VSERQRATNSRATRNLDFLLAPGDPTSDPLEMHRAVESPRRHDEGWVELMQMPTRPPLRPAALVDESLA